MTAVVSTYLRLLAAGGLILTVAVAPPPATLATVNDPSPVVPIVRFCDAPESASTDASGFVQLASVGAAADFFAAFAPKVAVAPASAENATSSVPAAGMVTAPPNDVGLFHVTASV